MSKVWFTPVLALVAVGAALVAPQLRGAIASGATAPAAVSAPDVASPAQTLAVHDAGVTVSVTADRAAILASGDRRVRLQLSLSADAASTSSPRTPTDLVVIMDRSGSMGGDKLLDAKAAAAELVAQLHDDDRFALVTFASDATVDVPMSAGRSELLARIETLQAGGGTEMADGLNVGLGALGQPASGRSRRVVLISDGLPNSEGGLEALAVSAARSESPLTTIGIGLDYNETLMQRLADAGTGNFHWAQRGPQLADVLGDELATARETVASGLRLDMSSDIDARIVDAAGYPVVGGGLQLGTLFAGQQRTLWVTVELPPGIDVGDLDPGAFTVTWNDPTGAPARAVAVLPSVSITDDAEQFYASVDSDQWSNCVVEEDFNGLRSTVSAALQQGDAEAARGAIAAYQQRVGTMNAFVQSAEVTGNLAQVDTLAAEVEEQLVNPQEVRNAWAKGNSNQAYQGRRGGQSKSW